MENDRICDKMMILILDGINSVYQRIIFEDHLSSCSNCAYLKQNKSKMNRKEILQYMLNFS